MITLTREEAQQVLDALDYVGYVYTTAEEDIKVEKVIETLRTRLVQPEPSAEPVAWISSKKSLYQSVAEAVANGEQFLIPLYTTQSKREWHWLTDEEIEKLAQWADEHGHGEWHKEFARAIESKSKEKNT